MLVQNTLAMLPMLLITMVSGEAATLRKLDWGWGARPQPIRKRLPRALAQSPLPCMGYMLLLAQALSQANAARERLPTTLFCVAC